MAHPTLVDPIAADGNRTGPAGTLPRLRPKPPVQRIPQRGARLPELRRATWARAADDAPPYFTILIAGHIVVPLLLLTDRLEAPPLWVLWATFLPLTLILTLGLIRPVKGATVGLMLKLTC